MAQPYYLSNGNQKDTGVWQTYFLYNSGTSGPGTAWGQLRGPGAPSLSAAAQFVATGTGTPLAIADGGMSNVTVAENAPLYFVFTPVIDGETAPSVWFSSDGMVSWTRIV